MEKIEEGGQKLIRKNIISFLDTTIVVKNKKILFDLVSQTNFLWKVSQFFVSALSQKKGTIMDKWLNGKDILLSHSSKILLHPVDSTILFF